MSETNETQIKEAYEKWVRTGRAGLHKAIEDQIAKRQTWVDKGIKIPVLERTCLNEPYKYIIELVFPELASCETAEIYNKIAALIAQVTAAKAGDTTTQF